jgi:nucleotide-binding universal stress UspA family protein
MKILLAADGSKYTKKALAFLMANESMCGPSDELLVLHVQPPVPPRVKTLVGAAQVKDYYREESEKVLAPIASFLKRHDVRYRPLWRVGHPGDEIVAAVGDEKAQMLVMGSHGRGVIGRALMGSVAQQVLSSVKVPVLLVK